MNLNFPTMDDRIVAIGLLTNRDLRLLGPAFDRAWPLEDASQFENLLRAIDEAERALEEEQVHAG